jgi:hypothetical protein
VFSNYPIFYPHTDSTKTVDERPRRVRSVGFCYLLLLCGEGQERWVGARDESVVDGRWLSLGGAVGGPVGGEGKGDGSSKARFQVKGKWIWRMPQAFRASLRGKSRVIFIS